MWHVDDGTLHAYLDNQLDPGAQPGRQEIEVHLAECPQCRTLLEDARRLRERARGILSESSPQHVVAPPFADVLARAARRQTRRSTRPAVVLAWAASLALAVTAGWYARSLLIGRAPGNAAANMVAMQEPARAAGIEAKAPAEAPVSAGAGAVSSTTGVAAQNRPVADVALAEAKGAVDTEARKAEEAHAPAAPPSAPALAQVPAAAPTTRRTERQEMMFEVEQGWVTVSPAEAARRLGGPVAMIPGLPSLGTSVSGTGESVVARTIQVLGPGQTIELVQQRTVARERAAAPAVAAQAGAPLRDTGAGPVTVQWEGFSVRGSALVPQDSLRKLLQRLTAAEPLR